MPPPIVYRFEPRQYKDGTVETWEAYLTRVSIYFNLSVADRTTAIYNFQKYANAGVDKYCAGYVVLRESGLFNKMLNDVANLRPHRKPPNM